MKANKNTSNDQKQFWYGYAIKLKKESYLPNDTLSTHENSHCIHYKQWLHTLSLLLHIRSLYKHTLSIQPCYSYCFVVSPIYEESWVMITSYMTTANRPPKTSTSPHKGQPVSFDDSCPYCPKIRRLFWTKNITSYVCVYSTYKQYT